MTRALYNDASSGSHGDGKSGGWTCWHWRERVGGTPEHLQTLCPFIGVQKLRALMSSLEPVSVIDPLGSCQYKEGWLNYYIEADGI